MKRNMTVQKPYTISIIACFANHFAFPNNYDWRGEKSNNQNNTIAVVRLGCQFRK